MFTFHPPPRATLPAAQTWLLNRQDELAERVGEPVMLLLRLVYDGYLEVELITPSGRSGLAVGGRLTDLLEEAVEMLLALDALGLAPRL